MKGSMLAMWLLCCAAGLVQAGEPGAVPTSQVVPVDARELDEAIDEVLSRPEFRWRPGPQARSRHRQSESQSLVGRFFTQLADAVDGVFDTLEELMARFMRWWRRQFGSGQETGPSSGESGIATSWLLYGSALAVALILAFLLWRRSRRRETGATLAAEPLALSELAAEESAADQVEPRRWRQWALELAADGKLREAIRAVHLAGLSELARGGLLRLERFKSNLDYLAELRRRCRTAPDLPECFAANVGVYERVWYGRAPASVELLETSLSRVDRMSHGAAPAA